MEEGSEKKLLSGVKSNPVIKGVFAWERWPKTRVKKAWGEKTQTRNWKVRDDELCYIDLFSSSAQ